MTRLMRWGILLVCAFLPLRAGAQTSYRGGEVGGGRVLSGVVRAEGERAVPDVLPISKDPKICGARKSSDRWRVGKSGGVAGAVVYIENITAGKPSPEPSRHTLAQTACQYVPHVMVVPLGSELEIVNNDPILHNVHAYETAPSPRSVFNIAQPVRGQRTVIKTKQLSRPGFLNATCDAGHPWMDATIVVAPHPYYAVTDTDGVFRFDHVPPGTYTVAVWHDGVRIVRKELEQEKVKKYVYEEPYILRQEIIVPSDADAKAAFALTLR